MTLRFNLSAKLCILVGANHAGHRTDDQECQLIFKSSGKCCERELSNKELLELVGIYELKSRKSKPPQKPNLIPHTKINLEWIVDLNVVPESF